MLRLLSYLLLLMLFLTACTSKETTVGEDGFPEFSEEQLQEMIKNNPQLNGQTSIPQQNGNEELIRKMETLLEQNPDDLNNNYHLAKLYYQKYLKDSLVNDCQKAISLFSNVIKLDAEYEKGHAYYNRMLCYYNNNQLDAALKDIDAFVLVNKGRTPVNYLSMRAEIFFKKGNKEQACIDFKSALVVAQKDSLPVENEAIWKERCGL